MNKQFLVAKWQCKQYRPLQISIKCDGERIIHDKIKDIKLIHRCRIEHWYYTDDIIWSQELIEKSNISKILNQKYFKIVVFWQSMDKRIPLDN